MYDLQLLVHGENQNSFRVHFSIVRRCLGPESVSDWRNFESIELAMKFFKSKFTSLTGIKWEDRIWPFLPNDINRHNRWTIAGIGAPFMCDKENITRYLRYTFYNTQGRIIYAPSKNDSPQKELMFRFLDLSEKDLMEKRVNVN